MIAVQDIAYVRVPTPDLDVMEKFLTDFGMSRVERTQDRLYMRGCGPQPFIHVSERAPFPGPEGIGFWAKSLEDLHSLGADTGKPVEENTEPGGGWIVRLTDPAGLKVDVVYGHAQSATPARRPSHPVNFEGRRARKNHTQRFEAGPSSILRFGHVVLRTPDFKVAHDWYTGLLGMKISDRFFDGEVDNTVMAFLHCDLGQDYTDHHTVALIGLPHAPPGIDHAAFEVLDFDDLMIGHEYLAARGYPHSWGIGRHVEGSQLFDYWRDPNGVKIEHWTDGDAVNEEYVGHAKPMAGPGSVSPWGPEMTPEFFR